MLDSILAYQALHNPSECWLRPLGKVSKPMFGIHVLAIP